MILPPSNRVVLTPEQWLARAARHREIVRPWTESLRQRRSHHRRHPVHDFLFDYYSYRPSQLESWHPGFGEVLLYKDKTSIARFARRPEYTAGSGRIQLCMENLSDRSRQALRWIRSLLLAVESRPPRFGCSGLHEWAMVYRTPAGDRRHEAVPLRLSPDEIAAVVESQPLVCTHYDAFRFFSGAARPLNRSELSRESVMDFEQAGCLHTNMDLYRWAYKLVPWIGGDLILETFLLAARVREIDMRASPYDLSELELEPIPIETDAGRAEYESHQRRLSHEAAPLRRRLIEDCMAILEAAGD